VGTISQAWDGRARHLLYFRDHIKKLRPIVSIGRNFLALLNLHLCFLAGGDKFDTLPKK